MQKWSFELQMHVRVAEEGFYLFFFPLLEISYFYLDKEWNGVEPSDNNSVVNVPGQDVQSSCAAFHYFLHAHALLYVVEWKQTHGNQIQCYSGYANGDR